MAFSLVFQTSYLINNITTQPHTQAAVSFGAADPQRWIILALGQVDTGTISAVSIGGVSATLTTARVSGQVKSRFAYANVPTGTTGDILITNSTTVAKRIVVGVYRVIDLKSVSETGGASNSAGSLAMPSGGGMIGQGCTAGNSAFTWSGLTIDQQTVVQTSRSTSAMSTTAGTATRSYTGGSTPTISVLSITPLVHYTMTADAASYSWSGENVNLLSGFTVQAQDAAYTWSAQDVNLIHAGGGATIMPADLATYAWSPQDVGLYLGYRVAADLATFNWSPQDIAFGRTARLVADPAAYAWNPQNVNLLRGYLIGADLATYAWTPQDVQLKAGRVVGADATAYSWSPQNVNLYFGYRVAADVAAYNWTPQAVALRAIRTMPADAAAYNWNVQSVNLYFGHRLYADVADYQWSPQPVILYATRKIDAEPADYQWGANDVHLRKGFNFNVDPAQYEFQGADVEFPLGSSLDWYDTAPLPPGGWTTALLTGDGWTMQNTIQAGGWSNVVPKTGNWTPGAIPQRAWDLANGVKDES